MCLLCLFSRLVSLEEVQFVPNFLDQLWIRSLCSHDIQIKPKGKLRAAWGANEGGKGYHVQENKTKVAGAVGCMASGTRTQGVAFSLVGHTKKSNYG